MEGKKSLNCGGIYAACSLATGRIGVGLTV